MKTTAQTEPIVTLENAFNRPYENAVATARTCYSSRIIRTDEVSRDEKAKALRDEIAQSTYQAGHHTTLQHATFQFAIEHVSRQFIWGFLHSHPFYNSEQVSQRYVEVKPGAYFVPPLDGKALPIYHETALLQMDAYHRLNEILGHDVEEAYFETFSNRRRTAEQWKNAIKKKAQELSRYVLPVATFAHLYHTISGLTLHRYHRLQEVWDTPFEQKLVVDKMTEAVRAVDPLFFKNIEDPIPLEQTMEYQYAQAFQKTGKVSSADFIKEFDQSLSNHISKLIDYKARAEQTMAQSVRCVFGLSQEALSDREALDCVLNPARNRYLSETLNFNAHSKLGRTMVHPHFTFRKKLSHAADSQNERHRMTPASRPILAAHFQPQRPDYITPPLVRNNPQVLDLYSTTMKKIWERISQILNLGVSREFALYLLPNAFPIRFEESGDLLNCHHKWTTRLCYTAQEEIWRASLEEVTQVGKIHPILFEYLLPPCGLRAKAGQKPICPEGKRFCGVAVWKLKRRDYSRKL